MHKSSSQTSSFPPQNSQHPSASSCPIKSANTPLPSSSQPSYVSKLNPLNYMPSNISQSRSDHQRCPLPVDRELSSIPRGDTEGNWEYPSPQQMYNAMIRKGYDDTPEDAVESMVAVHNFLNEGAWAEIVGWERRFSRGLSQGWKACQQGEEGFAANADRIASPKDMVAPKLLRFQGRPNDMTPKARILEFVGRLYPQKFRSVPRKRCTDENVRLILEYSSELPFDRHDWYVQRTNQGQVKEVRYVIDYYSGPPEPTGQPVFYLDVRPAVDGPTAAAERMMRWGGDIWHRASGGAARETASA